MASTKRTTKNARINFVERGDAGAVQLIDTRNDYIVSQHNYCHRSEFAWALSSVTNEARLRGYELVAYYTPTVNGGGEAAFFERNY